MTNIADKSKKAVDALKTATSALRFTHEPGGIVKSSPVVEITIGLYEILSNEYRKTQNEIAELEKKSSSLMDQIDAHRAKTILASEILKKLRWYPSGRNEVVTGQDKNTAENWNSFLHFSHFDWETDRLYLSTEPIESTEEKMNTIMLRMHDGRLALSCRSEIAFAEFLKTQGIDTKNLVEQMQKDIERYERDAAKLREQLENFNKSLEETSNESE